MRTLFFILLSYVMFSCSKSAETLLPELSRAENLMQEYPDSALAVLDSMQTPSPSDKMQYATWCLLYTQAQDKNYNKQTSDSLINTALLFFEKQDDLNKKALALYYKGKVADDLQNGEEAIFYYLQAKDLAKEIKDYKLLQIICANLGMIYAYRNLNDQALPEIKEAYNYSLQISDSTNISYLLSYLGRISSLSANWDSCICYYNQAIQIAEQTKSPRALCLALNEISYVYAELNEYNLAIDCLKKSEKITLEERFSNIYQTYLLLGHTYKLIEKYDSAFYYLNKSLNTDNIYTLASAYQNLYLLNEKQKKFKEAIEYNNQYQIYADSVTSITRVKAISEMQAKYEHEKLLNKNSQLQIENGNILKTGLLILIFIICTIASIILIYQQKLLRKERFIQKDKEQIRSYTIILKDNESIIRENEKHINFLTSQLEKSIEQKDQSSEQLEEIQHIQERNKMLEEENEILQKKMNRYSLPLLIENDKEMSVFNKLVEQNAYLLEHDRFLFEQLINRIEILSSLKQNPKYLINEQWLEITNMVDMLNSNYSQRLRLDFSSLTEEDLRYCCLIKLRLPTSIIAVLTGISPASVTKRKQRIKEKINLQKLAPLSKDQSIEEFLWGF